MKIKFLKAASPYSLLKRGNEQSVRQSGYLDSIMALSKQTFGSSNPFYSTVYGHFPEHISTSVRVYVFNLPVALA